jgi:hypothetical protein
MKFLKRKKNKFEKKRKIRDNKMIKDLKPFPGIDPLSQIIIDSKEHIYEPIQKRAHHLHSLKISQMIFNEEKKQRKKKMEENKKNKSKSKNYDEDEWNAFIENQYQWKDDIEFKKIESYISRDEIKEKSFFKPKINNKSKSIIKKIEKNNNSYLVKAYIRLFNDYEENKERQRIRNEQYMQLFRPSISKKNSKKNLFRSLKKMYIPRANGTNPLVNYTNYIMNKTK